MMNRRDRGNGQGYRSGYGHGRDPDAEVSLVADCRPAVAVAADFHPEVDSRPEVGSSPEEDFRREGNACSGRRARIYLYRHSGSRTVRSRHCDR